MNCCKQKLFYTAIGFLAGNILLASLLFAFSSTRNIASFDATVARVEQNQLRETRVNTYQTNLVNAQESDLLLRLFQMLFWLFLVSPPVIVVLLLVIIKKLDAKKSLD